MKDWEITEAYFLPRILCWRTATNTLPGNVPKPNLRFFSLGEDNQWTAWKSSDYFYPEMIPEPDYSDSADDSGEEAAYSIDRRSAIERLRDLTEVYVTNVSAVTSEKKSPAGSAPKSTQKQKSRPPTAKKEADMTDKPPPSKAAKTPTQKRTKSPTGRADKPAATPTTKRTKSPQPATKTAPKRKPSPKRKAESADEPKTASADNKTSKAKPASPKSKRKTSPRPKPKAKAAIADESTTKGAGDVRTKSGKSSLSSPATSGQSQSSETYSSDEEQQHLIKPRKPYTSSSEKQKLHKELKFSQKYGKLSSSKTELQLALERYTENKVKRELDAEEKSSLEKILEYQARKIEMQETMDKSPTWIERLQRPPSLLSDPNKEEFYRVHARVVSSSVLTHCFLPDDESPTSDGMSLKSPSDSSSDS